MSAPGSLDSDRLCSTQKIPSTPVVRSPSSTVATRAIDTARRQRIDRNAVSYSCGSYHLRLINANFPYRIDITGLPTTYHPGAVRHSRVRQAAGFSSAKRTSTTQPLYNSSATLTWVRGVAYAEKFFRSKGAAAQT